MISGSLFMPNYMIKAYTNQRYIIDDMHYCTLLAMMHTCYLTYTDAYELFQQFAGRARYQPVSLGDCIKVYGRTDRIQLVGFYGAFQCLNAGAKAKSTKFKECSLQEFIEANPKGRFMVHLKGHCTAVVDGRLFDAYDQDGKQSVVGVWQVIL